MEFAVIVPSKIQGQRSSQIFPFSRESVGQSRQSAILIRAVPYVRKRAEERRQEDPEESLAGLLGEMKQARTEREIREKLRGRRM